MKIFVFIFAIGLTLSTAGWLTDFDRAKEIARQENKLILLNFSGSDWCAPCIMMKKDVFDKPEFQEYSSEKLVLVRADFPRHKKNQPDPETKVRNEKLASQYNRKGAFPLTLLLDPEGKVIKEWDGFQGMSPGEFISQIKAEIHAK